MSQKSSKNTGAPVRIGQLLEDVLPKHTMPQALSAEVCVFKVWKEATGSEIAKNARPTALKNGVLFVETKHAVWSTELQMRSDSLRKKINALAGAELVREIQFRQGRL